MKILMCSNSCWSFYNYRYNLIKFLVKKGHKLIIACPLDKYSNKLKKLDIIYYPIEFKNKSFSIFDNFFLIIKFFYLFLKFKPNIYIGYTIKPNIFGCIVAKILKINSIMNITGLGSMFLTKKYQWLFFFLIKIAVAKNTKIFFQNRDDKSIFLKKKIINKKNSFVLPGSGISINSYKKKKPIYKNSLIYIGRFLKDKGFMEYVRAAKYFKKYNKKIKFLAIGKIDKNNPSEISETFLGELKKKKIITFLKYTENKSKIYEYSSCIIIPSYREGLSKTILEAGLRKKFVLASNVPGCNSIITNNIDGLLFKSRSAQSLITCIKRYQALNQGFKNKILDNLMNKVQSLYNENIIFNLYKDSILHD